MARGRASKFGSALRLVVASVVVAGGLLAVFLVMMPKASEESTHVRKAPTPEDVRSYSIQDQVLQSVGDAIDDADAVVIARVASIDSPRWNSKDGLDWREEFDKSPSSFTIPTIFTAVNLDIVTVIYARQEGAAPALGDNVSADFLGDPSLDMLDQPLRDELTLEARAVFLAEGDTGVFFLRWLPFPLPDGEGDSTWRVSTANGLWGISSDGEAIFPTNTHQIEDLQQKVEVGDAADLKLEGVQVALTTEGFTSLVLEEAKTPSEPVG